MKVFVNYLEYLPRWGIKNTDVKYTYNFLYLKEINSEIEITTNKNIISNLIFFMGYALQRFFTNKFLLSKIENYTNYTYLFKHQLRDIDAIYSHGTGIKVIGGRNKDLPIVLDWGFMTNEYVGAKSDEERLPTVNLINTLAKSHTLLILNSNDAIKRLVAFKPSLEPSLRLAPTYILSKLDVASKDSVREKFINFDKGKVVLTFIGGQGKRKGLRQLLDGLSFLKAQNIKLFERLDIHIVSNEPDLLESFRQLGKNVYFEFHLPYSQVKGLLLKTHIFCMPTLKDAFGLVYLEAMANACIIIADNRHPRMEMLENGKCGYLVNPYSHEEISNAIQQILTEPEEAMAKAEKGYSKYIELYDKDVVANKYIQFLKESIEIKREDKTFQKA